MMPRFRLWIAAILFTAMRASADSLEIPHAPALPDAGASVFRVCGAFILVVALFLGGAWLFKNWQRLTVQKNGGAKLSLLEAKSLGQRQTIYVVGYEQQRLLVASSPAGITVLSHLPEASEAPAVSAPAAQLNFAQALQHVLSRGR